MVEHYVIHDFRNHPSVNTRFEMHSSDPTTPLEGRYWFNSNLSVPYIRSNGINLPLVAKDDNFYNAPEITSNNDADALLVWSHTATSNYQFGKYRRISYANLKAQFGSVNNAFKTLSGNTGTNIVASGEDTFAIWGDGSVIETSGNHLVNRLQMQFKSQLQNTFFAGPSSGGSGTPAFRSILISDLPSGIMTGYTKAEIDAFFEGESAGKKLVHWDNILYKPAIGGYWQRIGTTISTATPGDTLAIGTIKEEVLNSGIYVTSKVYVNTGKAPGLSRFKHGLEINYGQGIVTLDNFTVHTNLYAAIVVNSNDNSLLLMNNALGKIGFFSATPSAQSTGWTVTNHSEDKAYNITETTVNEIARVLGTVITELKTKGLIGS